MRSGVIRATTTPRRAAHLDQAADGELAQRLPHRRARGAEAIGELLLVEGRAGDERARRDLVGQRVADAVGEQPAIVLPRSAATFEHTLPFSLP